MSLSSTPGALTVTPGTHALFRIDAQNNLPLARDVTLSVNTTAGWVASFTPPTLSLPGGGKANATLDLLAPQGAPTNATFVFPVTATDSTTSTTATTNVTVTIAAPADESAPPPAVVPPTMELSVPDESGDAGSVVRGTLTLIDTDKDRAFLDVSLAIGGPAAWMPRFTGANHTRLIYNAPQSFTVEVTLPADAGNASASFPVTAAAGEYQFAAIWHVTSRAVASPPPATGSAPSDGSGPSSSQTGTTPPARPHFVLEAGDLQDLTPGFASKERIVVRNDGNVPLHIALRADAGDGSWPATLTPATMDLGAGETRDVLLTLDMPASLASTREGSARATVTGIAEGGLSTFLNLDLRIPATAAPVAAQTSAPIAPPPADAPNTSHGAAIAVAAGLGAVGAGALVLMHRPWREKILWAGVGLYTRLARPDVLGHEERERLYKIVEAQPGIHFHALQRDLGWNTGTLTYHLRVLEKHGFVVDRRDGLFRRFYLAGSAPRKETFETSGPQGLRGDVLEAIRGREGLSQSDLALALGANKQTVNYHVKALERQGLIRVEKRGRETFLYPGAGEAPAQREAHA